MLEVFGKPKEKNHHNNLRIFLVKFDFNQRLLDRNHIGKVYC